MAGADQVVHFAAESHVDRSIASAGEFVRTNVCGTQTLLDAALRHGVERFVHVSTDEVYGSRDTGSFSEEDRLDPNSPYAASKAASDLIALSYHRTHGLDVRVTRCSNNYGPRQFPRRSSRFSLPGCSTAVRYRCTATASTCVTGCTSKTTAAAWTWCAPAGAPGRSTTSVAAPS